LLDSRASSLAAHLAGAQPADGGKLMATVNSGLTIRVTPRALYNFTGLGAGPAQSVILIAQHIDVSVFQEVDILVRFHGGTIIPTTATVTVGLLADGYDFSDPAPATTAGVPSAFFGPNVASGQPGVVQATNATSFPAMFISSMNQGATTTPFSRLLAVQLVAVGGTAAGAMFQALLSVDLVCKGGDPSHLPMMPNGFCGYRLL
jgi:hypothetical protein